MAYIHNGKVVDRRPFSITRGLEVLVAYVVFFFSSLLSVDPFADQVRLFQSRGTTNRTAGGGTYTPFSNILGFERGGGGSVSRGTAPTATGRPSTMRQMPARPLGGCAGAGG